MNARWIATAAFLLTLLLSFASPALAKTVAIEHGGTFFGKDVLVTRDQVIDGDVTVVFGDLIVEGTVNGNATDIGGSIEQRPGSTITGKVSGFGEDYVASIAPWAASSGASAVVAENARMMTRLTYGVIILLVFLIFPVRVRVALGRLEHHPGLSAAVGMLVIVAIVPIMILLIVSIIGIPLIAVEFAAVVAGVFIGQAALGMLVGRRLFELVRPHTTPSPLAALVLGLVFISAAEIIPVVGTIVTILVLLVGLGAAALAFVREAPGSPGTLGTPRAPISGPPMNPA